MTLQQIETKFSTFTPSALPPVREAAVLAPLVEVDGKACLLFEVRSRTLSHQPGEICFPGGGMEPGETPEGCALRETAEELGLTAVRILSPLTPMRHISGRIIYPLLGRLEGLEGLRLQPAEVEEVFTVPVDWFRSHPPRLTEYTTLPELDTAPAELLGYLPHYRQTRSTPVWVYEGHVLWGMTARVVMDILAVLTDN